MNKTKLILALVAGFAFSGLVQAQTNLIHNGGFELGSGSFDPEYGLALTSGSTDLQDWSIIGGSGVVWYENTSILSDTYTGLATASGYRFVNLAGNWSTYTYSAASLTGVEQTVSTQAQTRYRVSFSFGNNNEFNAKSSPNGVNSLRVSAAGSEQTYQSNFTDDNVWANQTFEFVATGATTTLRFVAASNGHYFGLDNVSMVKVTVPAVPEPESYAMLLAGLGLMGVIARRRSGRR